MNHSNRPHRPSFRSNQRDHGRHSRRIDRSRSRDRSGNGYHDDRHFRPPRDRSPPRQHYTPRTPPRREPSPLRREPPIAHAAPLPIGWCTFSRTGITIPVHSGHCEECNAYKYHLSDPINLKRIGTPDSSMDEESSIPAYVAALKVECPRIWRAIKQLVLSDVALDRAAHSNPIPLHLRFRNDNEETITQGDPPPRRSNSLESTERRGRSRTLSSASMRSRSSSPSRRSVEATTIAETPPSPTRPLESVVQGKPISSSTHSNPNDQISRELAAVLAGFISRSQHSMPFWYKTPQGAQYCRGDPMQVHGDMRWSIVMADELGPRIPAPVCIVPGSSLVTVSSFYEIFNRDPDDWNTDLTPEDVNWIGQASLNVDYAHYWSTPTLEKYRNYHRSTLSICPANNEPHRPGDFPERFWCYFDRTSHSPRGFPYHIGVDKFNYMIHSHVGIWMWICDVKGSCFERLNMCASLFFNHCIGLQWLLAYYHDELAGLIPADGEIHPLGHLPIYLRTSGPLPFKITTSDTTESNLFEFFKLLITHGGLDVRETHVLHALAEWAGRYLSGVPSNRFCSATAAASTSQRTYFSRWVKEAPWTGIAVVPPDWHTFEPYVAEEELVSLPSPELPIAYP